MKRIRSGNPIFSLVSRAIDHKLYDTISHRTDNEVRAGTRTIISFTVVSVRNQVLEQLKHGSKLI